MQFWPLVVLIGFLLSGCGTGVYVPLDPTKQTISNSECRPQPLAAVYHPQRLEVRDACKTVSGTVQHVINEKDGDYHIRLRLDPQYAGLINARNVSAQHGDLVVEFIPVDRPHLPAPHVGDHWQLTGAYVLDKQHGGWAELHPSWRVVDLATGKTWDAPPPSACAQQHPEDALEACK